jgi:hypothetical protein
MPGDKKRKIQPYGGGFFGEISNHIKLVLRLMRDRRVSPFLKIIPFGTLAYFFIPDLVFGPFDDAAVIGIGLFIFVELCPPDVVEEHRAALAGTLEGQWRDPHKSEEDDVVDAEFKDEQ